MSLLFDNQIDTFVCSSISYCFWLSLGFSWKLVAATSAWKGCWDNSGSKVLKISLLMRLWFEMKSQCWCGVFAPLGEQSQNCYLDCSPSTWHFVERTTWSFPCCKNSYKLAVKRSSNCSTFWDILAALCNDKLLYSVGYMLSFLMYIKQRKRINAWTVQILLRLKTDKQPHLYTFKSMYF